MKTKNPSDDLEQGLQRHDSEMISAAIASGADLSARYSDGYNAVSAALYEGDDVLSAVLLAGVDPDLQLDGELSALERAIIFDREIAVGLLLQHGASLGTRRNSDQDTALHCCAREGGVKIAGLLFRSATLVDLNRQNRMGESALSCAVDAGSYEKASILLELHAEVNPVENNGIPPKLPLVQAIKAKNRKLVELLLARGADPLAKGWNGLSAQMHANSSSDPEIRRLLGHLD